MRRSLLPAAGLAALLVAGCSSVHRDTAFSEKSDKAFVLLAADGMPVTGSLGYSFAFQRIDLAKAAALDSYITISFDGMALGGDEFGKPDGMKTLVRFGGRVIPAGDYALMGRFDTATYGTSVQNTINCFSLGAAVFHLEPGRIAVVAAGNVRAHGSIDASTLPAQISQVLGGYPQMTAPVTVAAPIGVVTFKTGKSLLGTEVCQMQDGFAFTPQTVRRPVITASAMP
ncbi:MAG TPA: hypothetical protein VGM68_08785 [Rhizomicrobium sp.]